METTTRDRELTPTPAEKDLISTGGGGLPADHVFVVPTKCVKSFEDMASWNKSAAYHDIIGFINGISVAIQGKRISSECVISENMRGILKIIEQFSELVDETPPINQPQRFGNQAYRTWFQKMQEKSAAYLKDVLPEVFWPAISEIVVYLTESFGNSTRIDYGTGHELAFIMFLCCLYKIHIFNEADNVACALKLFNNYLILARKLQKTYRMEPAGSQGVWSLDDYQFVPFIWGSAQLAVKSLFQPSQFLEEKVLSKFKDEYMFIGCIDYICQVKTGNFAEHSNQLWSVSAVSSWSKINAGLVRMYEKEIMSKFPVIQHVFFGSLMSFKALKPGTFLSTPRLGMLPPAVPPPTFAKH